MMLLIEIRTSGILFFNFNIEYRNLAIRKTGSKIAYPASLNNGKMKLFCKMSL